MKFNGTVEELAKHLQTLTDRAAVLALLEGEDRTTAKDAINARAKELDGGTIDPPKDDGQGGTTESTKPAELASADPKDNPASVLDPRGPQPGDSPAVGVGEEARSAVETPANPPAASSVDYLDHSAPATDSHVMQTRLEAVLDKLPK